MALTSDLDLLEQWTSTRDANAFRDIVSRYGSMVYGTCRRVLGDAVEAEDVTQECFEHLAQATTGPRLHLGGWLHTVATHRSLDKAKEVRRRREREANFASSQQSSTQITRSDVYESIDEAIAELPEKLRPLLVAHFLQGQSHESIAKTTGIPRRTVTNRISKGLDQMGQHLHKRGIILETALLSTFLTSISASATPLSTTLTASLGKLSLLQTASSAFTVTAANTALSGVLGEVLTMKTVSIVAAVGIVIGAPWFFGRSGTDSNGGVPIVVAEADLGPIPPAQEIIAEYIDTLLSQDSIIFEFTNTVHVNAILLVNDASLATLAGERTFHRKGEFASDGNRFALRMYQWGKYKPRLPETVEKDPWIYRFTYDGNEYWAYGRFPASSNDPETHGDIGISRDEQYERLRNAYATSNLFWLQGYVSADKTRLDKLLSNTTSVKVRETREVLNGSFCNVIDFTSPYGDGTIWFDPQRGSNFAKASIHLKPGHINRSGEKITTAYADYLVDNVSFKNIDGVWVQTGATVMSDMTNPAFHEVRRFNPRLTNIRLNPDLDKLDVFTKDDIEEGAPAAYVGVPGWYRWQSGQLLPDKSKR